MVAEHKIDRQKLISGHNPVLTEIATDAPLTVFRRSNHSGGTQKAIVGDGAARKVFP